MRLNLTNFWILLGPLSLILDTPALECQYPVFRGENDSGLQWLQGCWAMATPHFWPLNAGQYTVLIHFLLMSIPSSSIIAPIIAEHIPTTGMPSSCWSIPPIVLIDVPVYWCLYIVPFFPSFGDVWLVSIPNELLVNIQILLGHVPHMAMDNVPI